MQRTSRVSAVKPDRGRPLALARFVALSVAVALCLPLPADAANQTRPPSLSGFASTASQAGRPSHVRRPLRTTGFRVSGTNGYTVFVTWLPAGFAGTPTPQVGIKAITAGAFSTYVVPGTASRTRIEAQFGALGTLDMTFHPSGRLGHYHPRCSGRRYHLKRRYLVKEGTWRGTINFTGEAGYTTVAASQAKPTYLFDPRTCESISGGKGDGGGWLSNAGTSTFFDAYQNGGPGTRTSFRAAEFEPGAAIGIYREVWVTGPPEAFTYNTALTNATVAPPPPFQGQASVQAFGKNRIGTLTGTLAASFPGGPTASLTGPDGAAHLEYAKVKIGH
jgi:hypothetical protein